MRSALRQMPDLELALLRQSVGRIGAACERCRHCQRTPLFGERVYIYGSGRILCELCRALRADAPLESRVVHGSELGHAVRIRDTRSRPAATSSEVAGATSSGG